MEWEGYLSLVTERECSIYKLNRDQSAAYYNNIYLKWGHKYCFTIDREDNEMPRKLQ